MNQTWEYLKGKKTYIGIAVGVLVVIAHKVGIPMPPGVQIDDNQFVNNLYTAAIAAFVRHGIS